MHFASLEQETFHTGCQVAVGTPKHPLQPHPGPREIVLPSVKQIERKLEYLGAETRGVMDELAIVIPPEFDVEFDLGGLLEE